ncbi:hypothetical protein LT85_0738 [Collimonas arenae]|uniref:Uncharacterized protein n=1 Tax=Collimonas arenae TaxID=279058 RepID=A0A0A1F5B4_9BURK|nr:hypothetical protein [Collimonas arenae]AIY39898.1 hypothetical protein LT85_0738 [Collimonas arenae]
MIFIRLLLFCFGVPIGVLVIGVLWLWGGTKLFGFVFAGGS